MLCLTPVFHIHLRDDVMRGSYWSADCLSLFKAAYVSPYPTVPYDEEHVNMGTQTTLEICHLGFGLVLCSTVSLEGP